MKLTIERRYKKSEYTIGWLWVDGELLSNTLEDTDRGLLQQIPTGKLNQMKVYGATAIPRGTYKVELSYSFKFNSRPWGRKYNGLVPHIMGVKSFEGVRIHPANKASQIEGCVAVGDNTKVGCLTNSTKRYYELMDKYLVPATKRKEEIWLTIE